jgi:hypothetical protein
MVFLFLDRCAGMSLSMQSICKKHQWFKRSQRSATIACVLITFIIACAFAAYRYYAIYVSPFSVFTENEVQEFLHLNGLADCGAYKKALALEAPFSLNNTLAHDLGICMHQDLAKAAALYKDLYKEHGGYYTPFRLALLHGYGPRNLRDKDKARFYFMETAIFLMKIHQYVPINFTPLLTEDPRIIYVPALFDTQVKSLESVILAPVKSRKSQIAALRKKGHTETSWLKDAVDSYPLGPALYQSPAFKELPLDKKIRRVTNIHIHVLYKLYMQEKHDDTVNRPYVTSVFRWHALSTDKTDDEQHLARLIEAGITLPEEFFTLHREASNWAESEKRKSAEELYKVVQAIDSGQSLPDFLISPTYKYVFRKTYLIMAAQRGHEEAIEALDKKTRSLIEQNKQND